jgi:hypothetical protein
MKKDERHPEIQWMDMRIKQCRAARERLRRLADPDEFAKLIEEKEKAIADLQQDIVNLNAQRIGADKELAVWREKERKLTRAIEAAEDHPELIPLMTLRRQLKQQDFTPEEVNKAFEGEQ